MQKIVGVLVMSCAFVACAGTSSGGESPAAGAAGAQAGGGATSAGGQTTDPVVPPPAQGASVFFLKAPSPASPGRACPIVSSTSGIPALTGSGDLDADTYLHKVIDGEDAAVFKCTVSGTSTFSFEATMQQAGRGFAIKGGTLGADGRGSAEVTVSDPRQLSSSLASSAPCTVDAAMAPGNSFQVKAGSMWASFDCGAVEALPSASCKASGFFVLENCDQK